MPGLRVRPAGTGEGVDAMGAVRCESEKWCHRHILANKAWIGMDSPVHFGMFSDKRATEQGPVQIRK